MRPKAGALRLVALLAFLASIRPISAQEVEAWFSRPGESASYATLKTQLLALAATERSAILTDRPLALRLIEGARKGVSPSKLVGILKDETTQLVAAAAVLREKELLPTDRDAANRLFLQLDIALRSGCDVADFSAALEGSIAKNGRGPAASTRAVAVLTSIAGMKIEKKDRGELITAIASGPLPDARLSSVRSTYADLVMTGVSSDDSLKNLRETLGPARQSPGDESPRRPPDPEKRERAGPPAGMGGPMPQEGPGAMGPRPGRR